MPFMGKHLISHCNWYGNKLPGSVVRSILTILVKCHEWHYADVVENCLFVDSSPGETRSPFFFFFLNLVLPSCVHLGETTQH